MTKAFSRRVVARFMDRGAAGHPLTFAGNPYAGLKGCGRPSKEVDTTALSAPTKVAFGIALLSLTAAAATGLFVLREQTLAADLSLAGSGPVRVSIQGPDGEFLFNGTVAVENGSALTALEEAARRGGLPLRIERYEMGAYVAAIAGHEAHGAHGWQYWVGRDGAWVQGDRSAEHHPVREGDWVQWRWSSVGDTAPFAERS